MKLFFITIISLSILIPQKLFSELNIQYNQLNNTHDIQLSPWGPYSKKYAGISHIDQIESGIRFDVSVFPGFYRNRVLIPNVMHESSYYPWEVNTEMTSITYRYELEWKDKVYVDVTYSILDSNTVIVSIHSVNNTPKFQSLTLNLISNICFPENYPIRKAKYSNQVIWLNALHYKDLTFSKPRPTNNLVYDGWLRAEERESDYLDGRAIAKDFGKDKGDKVIYQIPLQKNKGIIRVHYRMKDKTQTTIQTSGFTNQTLTFTGTGCFENMDIPYSITNIDNNELTLTSEGGNGIEINGFFIGNEYDLNSIEINTSRHQYEPTIEKDEIHKNIVLKYQNLNTYYGFAWNFSPTIVRELQNDELDFFFRKNVHEHVQKSLIGNKLGHYTNIHMRPLELAPNSEQMVYGLICNGEKSNINNELIRYNTNQESFTKRIKVNENTFQNILVEGTPYIFSQKMMQAALLSNIVYPIYTQNQYIRHFTPGKWWNCLYTWDSGFGTLGLAEIDMNKAIQNLNTYTTSGTSQSAFIHHGSPVPVQMYAFIDFWNKTQSTEFLKYFYPRLKQYYNFLTGKTEYSTTSNLNSKILKTWDYFYNSGGWDDYPAQVEVHRLKLTDNVTPVITTAHCIRSAKILKMAAEALNLKDDIKVYDNDINTFSNALQKYSWDETSGYFSYVIHDSLKNPIGILKHQESGENFNMGLDGAYPLFSGICNEKQEKILIDRIFSEKHMWTPSGISVVDQSAKYYRIDGYWNGSVWMPHQWFVWKTMLDLGYPELAFKIANKALEIWKNETDDTYFTFEHFFAKSGRGAGWHQFSGLSTPVMIWFSSYYKPGSVSVGFEVWIEKQTFDPSFSQYKATLAFDKSTPAHSRSILVCMKPSNKFEVLINGTISPYVLRNSGLLEIQLPKTNKKCEIEIKNIY